MLDVSGSDACEVAFAADQDPIEALLADRAHEALGVSVGDRCPEGYERMRGSHRPGHAGIRARSARRVVGQAARRPAEQTALAAETLIASLASSPVIR